MTWEVGGWMICRDFGVLSPLSTLNIRYERHLLWKFKIKEFNPHFQNLLV